MLEQLEPKERLTLVRFMCSFAWADLEIRPAERRFIADLVRRLGLDASERELVDGWLAHPPDPDSVDPAQVPPEHRQLFIEQVDELVLADDDFSDEEREQLRVFVQLLQ